MFFFEKKIIINQKETEESWEGYLNLSLKREIEEM